MEHQGSQKKLPEEKTITQQIKLIEIDLSRTSLEELPDFQNRFQYCTTLNLSGNNLKGGIPCLRNLKRLRWIDLSHNSLTKLSDVCGSISTLMHLNISHNNISELPEWILYLDKVIELNLGYNPISTTFQKSYQVAKWKILQVCNLENSHLITVPKCLESAPNLKELYIGNGIPDSQSTANKLSFIPKLLPSSLHCIEISHLGIVNLESNWSSLDNLKELRARGNYISWFSYDLMLLTSLQVCDLSNNQLTFIPKDFGLLKNLYYINLAFNRITALPQSFEDLKHLKHLDLYSNLVESIEFDFANLSSLEKCDMWMNLLDPMVVLATHENLCRQLRDTLSVEERSARKSEVALQPIYVSGDSDASTVTEMDGAEEEERAESIEGVNEEETWDEGEIYRGQYDVVTQKTSRSSIDVCDDDHYFLPAEFHPASYAKPPHLTNTVIGQFDDVD